jgi:ferredoxin--NADP+ reductase
LLGLGPGDPLLVERKPQGFFTLKWVPEARELWCVATGTGLGPFLSILRSPELWQRFERVVVAHGARDALHLPHRDDLDVLAAEHPGALVSVGLVSREPGTSGLLHGRVTTALADGSLERAAGTSIDANRTHVMLCGNPEMVEEMISLLAARGLKKHRVRNPGHITVEKYW